MLTKIVSVPAPIDGLFPPFVIAHAGGLRIVSTVSKPAEDAAINAVHTVMKNQPANLRQSLVAVDP